MAKIKYANEVIPLLNKHFGAVFQPNHTNQTMKSDSAGARTRWTNQINKQQGLMHAIRYWRKMSAGTKTNWNDFAAAFPQASRRNPALFLSGYQLFLKRNHYCSLSHGISTDFMENPVLSDIPAPEITISISASDNSVDVTEPYIRNFGMLPEPGQFLLIRVFPMAVDSGQFFAPIEQTIEVEEVFIDGLFVSFDLTGLNKNLTFSVYLSKVVHQSVKYVGTKVRYMSCFTPKTFLALTDTPESYAGQAGKIPKVKDDETGLEFDEGGGEGLTCETLINCPIIIDLIDSIILLATILSNLADMSVPPIKNGLLYNAYAMLNPKGLIKAGWHISTRTEMQSFRIAIANSNYNYDSSSDVGSDFVNKQGKAAGMPHSNWTLSAVSGAVGNNSFNPMENITGLSLRGSGVRTWQGAFASLLTSGFYWTSTPNGSTYFYYYTLTSNSTTFKISFVSNVQGLSIRIFLDDPNDFVEGMVYVGNDNRVYRVKKWGDFVFIVDNLAEEKYNDGSVIPIIEDNTDFKNDIDGAACAFDNNFDNV